MDNCREKYTLRLPEGMRDLIKGEALRNQRTMNAELVFSLTQIYVQREHETKKADATA